MVRALRPANAPVDRLKLPTDSEMVPLQGELVPEPFILTRREMVQPLTTKALL